MRQNQIVKELVAAGLFGTVYFGEGEYLHELRGAPRFNPTPWRRHWQQGINGITYGTHSLGPLLSWMPGDRVARVACAGTGHHYLDHDGRQYEAEDSSVMLGQMRSGGLVKVRVDMLSDRPHAPCNYQLQGTDGCYESARAEGERDRIWVRARSSETEWRDLEDLAEEFLPESWRVWSEAAQGAGHGGGDLIQMLDFVNCGARRHRAGARHRRGHGHDPARTPQSAVDRAGRRLAGRPGLPRLVAGRNWRWLLTYW